MKDQRLVGGARPRSRERWRLQVGKERNSKKLRGGLRYPGPARAPFTLNAPTPLSSLGSAQPQRGTERAIDVGQGLGVPITLEHSLEHGVARGHRLDCGLGVVYSSIYLLCCWAGPDQVVRDTQGSACGLAEWLAGCLGHTTWM